MGTTAGSGLPYPDDSEYVIGGAAAMQALAEAVDDRLTYGYAEAGRDVYQATVATDYGDLATVGPSVTLIAPPSGRVLTSWGATCYSGANQQALFGLDVIGPGGYTVSDADAASHISSTAGATSSVGRSRMVTGLTPGAEYTFTVRYRTAGGSSSFMSRWLLVEPR